MYNSRAPLLNSACVPSICFDVPEGTGRVLVHWLGQLGTTKTCQAGVPAYTKGILPTGAGDEDSVLYALSWGCNVEFFAILQWPLPPTAWFRRKSRAYKVTQLGNIRGPAMFWLRTGRCTSRAREKDALLQHSGHPVLFCKAATALFHTVAKFALPLARSIAEA